MANKQTSKPTLEEVRLTAPINAGDLERLRIGNVVYLDGLVYTGREGLYQKTLVDGEREGLDFTKLTNVNFHCSPAASVEEDGGYRVGAVTATASFRFSRFMADWFALSGAKVIIGKGGMSARDYRELFVPNGAVYLTTVGYGTGALLGSGIRRVRDVYWLEEMGIAQAVWLFEVERFGPFIVEGDLEGNSLFEQQNRLMEPSIRAAFAGLGAPALRRYGETDDRTDELI